MIRDGNVEKEPEPKVIQKINWLLLAVLLTVPFRLVGQQPPRDRHYIASRYNTATGGMVTEFAFSPNYRIYYGLDHYWNSNLKTQRTDIWGKADIFRSYLSRIWIGGGVEVDENSATAPFFKLRYDLHLRKFLLKNSYATNREFIFKISYEVRSFLAFELINFRSLGVRIDF